MLTGVCVATPVLPSGRRYPWPVGKAEPRTEDRTDWISGGTSGRAKDMAEGESKNRGKRKSTEDKQ